MKITRFVNGKRVVGGFLGEFEVENEVISSAIERVNDRINKKSFQKGKSLND